jgi:hypothetical protein
MRRRRKEDPKASSPVASNMATLAFEEQRRFGE